MTRPIFLTGMMGSGKSTVGRRLAERLGARFVDLDQRIEETSGKDIPALFAAGESSFRALERSLLDAELADPSFRVVALGGGALLDRGVRLAVLDHACLITLTAKAEVLKKRLSTDTSRPLLAGSSDRVDALLETRRAVYAEAHAAVATDASDLEHICDEVMARSSENRLAVALGERSYPVLVVRGLSTLRGLWSQLDPSGVFWVSDSNVAPLFSEKVRSACDSIQGQYVFAAGEENKHLATVLRGWEAAQSAGLDRRGVVLATGGGVTTDLGGFLASGWLRGVRWVSVSTTLLGMVDASIGGKTGVDLHAAKNVIGAFHQPSMVLADVSALATEPERSFVGGLAELVKTALIGDADLFDQIEALGAAILRRDEAMLEPLIWRAMRVKARVVSRDEHEQAERVWLNLGHTLGHALETAGGFSLWTHGEAVALGTLAALHAGVIRGRTEPSLPSRVQALFRVLGLPVSFSPEQFAQALDLLSHDKKRVGGGIRFVFVERVGTASSERIALESLRGLLTEAARIGGLFA